MSMYISTMGQADLICKVTNLQVYKEITQPSRNILLLKRRIELEPPPLVQDREATIRSKASLSREVLYGS